MRASYFLCHGARHIAGRCVEGALHCTDQCVARYSILVPWMCLSGRMSGLRVAPLLRECVCVCVWLVSCVAARCCACQAQKRATHACVRASRSLLVTSCHQRRRTTASAAACEARPRRDPCCCRAPPADCGWRRRGALTRRRSRKRESRRRPVTLLTSRHWRAWPATPPMTSPSKCACRHLRAPQRRRQTPTRTSEACSPGCRASPPTCASARCRRTDAWRPPVAAVAERPAPLWPHHPA